MDPIGIHNQKNTRNIKDTQKKLQILSLNWKNANMTFLLKDFSGVNLSTAPCENFTYSDNSACWTWKHWNKIHKFRVHCVYDCGRWGGCARYGTSLVTAFQGGVGFKALHVIGRKPQAWSIKHSTTAHKKGTTTTPFFLFLLGWLLSRELTYPTLGKGKSSTQKCRLVGDMSVSRRLTFFDHIFLVCLKG